MKDLLEKLCQHKTISHDEAKAVLIGIAQGKFDPVLVASFLTVFRMRNVTVSELSGFRDAMLELSVAPDLGTHEFVDLAGTGGDGKDTFNISTLSAFVVAGCGVPVVKHGNVSVSSVCGSSDVLTSLGVAMTSESEVLRAQLTEANICYLHAPLFHPAMKNVAPIRRALGVRTFFNLLGPLVNPARPRFQMIGVFSLEIARLFHYLLTKEEVEYLVVHSLDGYDEVSLTGEWRSFGRAVDGRGIDSVLSPYALGLERASPSELSGGATKEESAKMFLDILSGKGTRAQNDVVIANAGLAVQLVKGYTDATDGVGEARESLLSGVAFERFKAFRELTLVKE